MCVRMFWRGGGEDGGGHMRAEGPLSNTNWSCVRLTQVAGQLLLQAPEGMASGAILRTNVALPAKAANSSGGQDPTKGNKKNVDEPRTRFRGQILCTLSSLPRVGKYLIVILSSPVIFSP